MLSSEKYTLSGAYNTAIFENERCRHSSGSEHILSDKQRHGEELFNYMQSKGMYKVH